MTIHIQCPKCGRWKPAPDQWAGKLVECNDCKTRFKIPTASMEVEVLPDDQPQSPPAGSGSKPKPRPKPEPGPKPRPVPKPKPTSASVPKPAPATQPPPNTISDQCQACGNLFSAPSEWAGKRAKCPACGAAVEIPVQLTLADAKPAAGGERVIDVASGIPMGILLDEQPGSLSPAARAQPVVPVPSMSPLTPTAPPPGGPLGPVYPRRSRRNPFWKRGRPTPLGWWVGLLAVLVIAAVPIVILLTRGNSHESPEDRRPGDVQTDSPMGGFDLN